LRVDVITSGIVTVRIDTAVKISVTPMMPPRIAGSMRALARGAAGWPALAGAVPILASGLRSRTAKIAATTR
jgi:hypothetical protein